MVNSLIAEVIDNVDKVPQKRSEYDSSTNNNFYGVKDKEIDDLPEIKDDSESLYESVTEEDRIEDEVEEKIEENDDENRIEENLSDNSIDNEPNYSPTKKSPQKNKSSYSIDKHIRWFSELSNEDVSIAGGKGASLSEMYNAKFPVPPGFIVTAQAFDFFINSAGIKNKIKDLLKNFDMEETEELTNRSKKIRELIENANIPKELEEEILESYHILSSEKISNYRVSNDALNILKNSYEPIFVSVRSSATTEDLANASFAGQQESFLNVKGDRKLIDYIKRCFSSLYTPRAIYYRKKQGFGEVDALIAVVIQKMIDSEKSGVIFSKDPLNMNEDITLEAVYGLGEGIVSGSINPDNYVVSQDLKLKNIKIGDKKIAIVKTGSGENAMVKLTPERSKSRVLTNSEILEISNYALKLEEHYGKPQDIEFAIEEGKVYIIQSRPITTLKTSRGEVGEELTGNILAQGLRASPGIGVGVVRIVHSMNDLHKIKKGDVMVTKMTNPDMVVAMEKSVAIVTDEGGMTSHASIVSREMGIPAVVGTGNATQILKDGMKVTVDGNSGKIYEGEVAKSSKTEILEAIKTERIKLKLIVDLPEFAKRAVSSGIDSVGLLRLEGIIASSKKHPLQYEKEEKLDEYTALLEKGISEIAENFKSVWIRTSDIRTDEYSSLEGSPEREINPMLGLHGIRFSLKHPKIFEAELLAISNAAEKMPDKKFGVMFPQIISLDEVKKAKEFFNKFKKSNMSFGVMIETPAACQIIDDICNEGVNFISFGTNDLTQFTLGVDRGDDNVQFLYDELHPAVLMQLKRVIGACRRYKVETSICGQAGSRKEMVEFLFRKGINSISVNSDAAHEISKLISELEKSNVNTENKEEIKPAHYTQHQHINNQGMDNQGQTFNKPKFKPFHKNDRNFRDNRNNRNNRTDFRAKRYNQEVSSDNYKDKSVKEMPNNNMHKSMQDSSSSLPSIPDIEKNDSPNINDYKNREEELKKIENEGKE